MNPSRWQRVIAAVLVATAATVLWAPPVASAQEQTAAQSQLLMSFTVKQPPLERRLSIDVNGVAPRQVLESIARAADCTLALDPNVTRRVTMRVSRITVRTALDAVCESIGCAWKVEKGSLRVDAQAGRGVDERLDRLKQRVERRLPPSMKFEGIPLREVLAALSKAGGDRFTASDADAGRIVTVDLGGYTVGDALTHLMKAAGCSSGHVQWSPAASADAVLDLQLSCGGVRAPAGGDRDQGERIYSVSEGITAPVEIRNVRPVYTKAAMDAKIQGQVDVEFVIQKDGTVGDVRVTRSLDPGGLDEQAVKAVKQWLFTPGQLNGRPVLVRVVAQLMFTLR